MRKILYITLFFVLISTVMAVDIDINKTDIPTSYTYNQSIERGNSSNVTFFSNSSIVSFATNPLDIVVNTSQNSSHQIITFDLNDSHTVGVHTFRVSFNDSVFNTTEFIDYNFNVLETEDKFLQLDTTTYVYNLKTHEVDNPFIDTVPITVSGNGQAFVTCTDWLVCEPLSFNLSNTTVSYDVNVSTEKADAGTYTHSATFYLQDPINNSLLSETNITFIFNVAFEVEPLASLNETCDINNLSFSEYVDCTLDYIRAAEQRVIDLNNSNNVTVYVPNETVEYVEVIPWEINGTDKVLAKLLELKEIDRILKSERVVSRSLQDQIDELTTLNANITSKYETAIGSLPEIVQDIVSSLNQRLTELEEEKKKIERSAKAWDIFKEIGKWVAVALLIFLIYLYVRYSNPFWG